MSLRIKEFITIGFLIAFIIFVSTRDNYKNVSVNEIFNAVEGKAGIENMDCFDGSALKRDFGININDYDGVVYYGHETVMETETLLIIKLSDQSQGNDIIDTINSQRETNMELFKSYAPDQYELLNNSIVEQKGDYILYTVSDNAKAIEMAFSKCIKG